MVVNDMGKEACVSEVTCEKVSGERVRCWDQVPAMSTKGESETFANAKENQCAFEKNDSTDNDHGQMKTLLDHHLEVLTGDRIYHGPDPAN